MSFGLSKIKIPEFLHDPLAVPLTEQDQKTLSEKQMLEKRDLVKNKIISVMEGFLLTGEVEVRTCKYSNKPYTVRLTITEGLLALRALSKTYVSDPQSLQIAKEAIEKHGKDFALLQSMIKNPGNHAEKLGIDSNNPAQVYAARAFMKACIINGYPGRFSIEYIKYSYLKKMGTDKNSGSLPDRISEKSRMLMQGDPLKAFDPSKPHTSLDVVLGNVHFHVVKSVITQTTTTPGKPPIIQRQEYGPTREEAREIYLGVFTKLHNDPEIRHVIQALGTLIKKEKGNILIGQIAILGKPYHATILGGTAGFYQHHHSIFMDNFINPYDKRIIAPAISTFIHEALHFLFYRLGREDSTSSEEEERQLDEALAKDRLHRQNLDLDSFSQVEDGNYSEYSGAASVICTLSDHLEKKTTYFYGGFNPENPIHRKIMRVEAVVRIMEQIAGGVPKHIIERVAPNLYDFYFRVSKPKLIGFIEGNAHLFPATEVAPVARTVQVAASALQKPPVSVLLSPSSLADSPKPISLSYYEQIRQIWNQFITYIARLLTQLRASISILNALLV